MPSAEGWLLRQVSIGGHRVDCRLRDGVIAEVAPALEAYASEQVLTADGGALIPGLADHHVHLRALAAWRSSVDLSSMSIEDAACLPGTGVLRIVGAQAEFTRQELDQWWPSRPVRVQHRSGAVWTLNTAAVALLPSSDVSGDERRTGQFWRAQQRLRRLSRLIGDSELRQVSADFAARGVTHLTDATPDSEPPGDLFSQHILSLGPDGEGPRKIVIADHQGPHWDDLVAAVRNARRQSRGVALHAVTASALAMAIAALDTVGPDIRDRIEHAAVCSDAAARRLADLGVTVVTQPSLFARHGRTFQREAEPTDRSDLWRYGGLRRLGVRVSVGSDAPYGDLDPWSTVRAAAARASIDGEAVGPAAERVSPTTALTAMFAALEDPAGPPRRVAPEAPADVCVLGTGLADALKEAETGRSVPVMATFVRGRRIFAGSLE
jgi:predicted amidohydrolase YtcJ